MIRWFSKLLVLSISLNTGVHAAEKYISTTGTAAWGDCTSTSTPCSQATAISNAAAGDTVYFMDGTYSSGLNTATSGSCSWWSDSDSSKIVFRALNDGLAVITGTGSTSITVLLDTNCVALRYFTIKIPDEANSTIGIRSTGINNEISYNTVYYDGSLVPTTGSAHADAINLRARAWVHNNTIYSATVGVLVQGAGAGTYGYAGLVEQNDISQLTKGDTEDADCFAFQKNSADPNFSGFVIRHNTCSGWSDDGFDGFDSNNIRVEQNTFDTPIIGAVHPTCLKPGYTSTGNKMLGNTCLGIPTGGGTSVRCIDAQGSGSTTVSGNLCVGGTDGIYISQGSGTGDDNTFIHNTILDAARYGVFLAESTATGAILRNNFFEGGTSDMLLTSGGTVTGSYNRFINDKDSKGSGTYSDGTGDTEGAVTFDSDYRPSSDIYGVTVYPYWSVNGKCFGASVVGSLCENGALTVSSGLTLKPKARR